MELSFAPTLDSATTRKRLDALLVPEPLRDPALERRVDRLGETFRSFADSYPLPLWAPGLALTPEMRGLSEALFPLAPVRAVFERLLRLGCRFTPLLPATYLYSAATWFDLLGRVRPQLRHADPCAILRVLARDPEERLRFLFALLLPHHFGGSFDRYPVQSAWLGEWLRQNRERLGGGIRALDSACGSGEGTYGLAELILEAGFQGGRCTVHGSTLEPVELFAGAHAFFPHDLEREREYRQRVAPLLTGTGRIGMEFYLDEVGSDRGEGGYHVILCNGLLGGPLLHREAELERAVAALAVRLLPGGILLAADRFHEGWRLKVPTEQLRSLLSSHGLIPLELPQGVGGVKQPL